MAHRAALCRTGGTAADTCRMARSHTFNHEAKMCARTNIFAQPSIAQPRIARKRQSSLILLFKQNPKHYTMKRKCLLARAFSRGRQCRVRAAGTVGGKAPGGCKAASDEGNYTMKRKCLLARAFSRSRQWHIVRLSAARAAQPPILAAWQVSCDHYTTYSRFFKHRTHILAPFAAQSPNIRPCHLPLTALFSSDSSPNYVLLFQRIVPICEYTL